MSRGGNRFRAELTDAINREFGEEIITEERTEEFIDRLRGILIEWFSQRRDPVAYVDLDPSDHRKITVTIKRET